jgi:hypothetical protein
MPINPKHQVLTNAQAAIRFSVLLLCFISVVHFALTHSHATEPFVALANIVALPVMVWLLLRMHALVRLPERLVSKMESMLVACPAESRTIILGLRQGFTIRYRDYSFVQSAFIRTVI